MYFVADWSQIAITGSLAYFFDTGSEKVDKVTTDISSNENI